MSYYELRLGPAGRRGFPSAEDVPGSAAKIANPLARETLVLYRAVSEHAVSAVLVMGRVKEQFPVYYLSNALAGAEVNYPLIEKLAYALMMATQKLRPYFEAHKILVLTDEALKNVLQRLDASGWLLKWVSSNYHDTTWSLNHDGPSKPMR